MNKYNDVRLISYKELIDLSEENIKEKNPSLFNELLEKINEDNICVLCPTSGTTSNPKLAMISHKALLNHAENYLKADQKISMMSMFQCFLCPGL